MTTRIVRSRSPDRHAYIDTIRDLCRTRGPSSLNGGRVNDASVLAHSLRTAPSF